jgi:hypothetical protein
MAYVIAAPEAITSAVADWANIGSMLNAAKAASAAPTTGIVVAAEDEVSAAIAAVFSVQGKGFQALSAQAAAFMPSSCRPCPGVRARTSPPRPPRVATAGRSAESAQRGERAHRVAVGAPIYR